MICDEDGVLGRSPIDALVHAMVLKKLGLVHEALLHGNSTVKINGKKALPVFFNSMDGVVPELAKAAFNNRVNMKVNSSVFDLDRDLNMTINGVRVIFGWDETDLSDRDWIMMPTPPGEQGDK